ncbi:hypothetical protein TIFTF001_032449 [Ficus carica]|uniref:Uncharacterized protein n=1 Tax=Ficus carica TaxID=3494 RepID=A0AA88J6Q9_FICCA|nr:hypothetical protein TIFTF001_032449 [Ficus carica]
MDVLFRWMSFFQEIKQHESGGVIRYKMHDVIYDLVQSVTNSDYNILDRCYTTPTSFTQIRHSSVVRDFRSSTVILEELHQASHLRTPCLKILDGSMSYLLLLKYLDSPHTAIRKLPSEIEGCLKITHIENAEPGFRGFKIREGIESFGLYCGSDDGCPNINPEEEFVVNRNQTSLETLTGNLAALKSLTIRWCEEHSSLPQSLQNLGALESLEISDCHSLSSLPQSIIVARCREERDEDWPKIAHVPYKLIESPSLKRRREEGSSSSK